MDERDVEYSPAQLRLTKFDDLITLSKALTRVEEKADGTRYLYRGQSSKHDLIVPKGRRTTHEPEFYGEWRGLFGNHLDQHDILLRYKRTVHNVSSDLPPPKEWIEWMALIQHLGGPTNLVDFTESLMVAAYFCTTSSCEDGAFLWCAREDRRLEDLLSSKQGLIEKFERHARTHIGPHDKIYSVGEIAHQMRSGWGVGTRLLHYICDPISYRNLLGNPFSEIEDREFRKGLEGVVFARPFRLNRRLLAQQGVMAIALNQTNDFMDQLVWFTAVHFGMKLPSSSRQRNGILNRLPTIRTLLKEDVQQLPTVLRVWIPPHVVKEIEKMLRVLNVTTYSLFPDLQGYTDALNRHQFDPLWY
jgi:hypothetical protein